MEKKNVFLEDIGKRIVQRRKEMRLSQDELAEKAGVSPQVISTAERGIKELRAENLYKISKALSVSSDYLFTGETESIRSLYPEREVEGISDEQIQLIKEIIEKCIHLGNLTPNDFNK